MLDFDHIATTKFWQYSLKGTGKGWIHYKIDGIAKITGPKPDCVTKIVMSLI